MRMIGHLQSQPLAQTFSDFLYVKGIKNQLEAEGDGSWAVWIHAEEEIDHARRLLQSYVANPNDEAVRDTAAQADELKTRERENVVAAEKKHFDRDRLFPDSGSLTRAPLTLGLIILCVAVYLMQEAPSTRWILDYLLISEVDSMTRDLPEVRQGQVWRLLSPILLHFSFLHILFNMLWLRDLGTMMERRLGSWQLLLIITVVGVLSNVAQYFLNCPGFGGMSGVVYGLLGYVWMRGRFDPGSGFFLHPSTAMMMLIWLVLGYTHFLPVQMANTVHLVGLICGVVWGVAASRLK